MDFCRMSIRQELAFLDGLKLEGNMAVIAEQILREIRSRLRFLTDVGLQYLTLSRGLPPCPAVRASVSAWQRRSVLL